MILRNYGKRINWVSIEIGTLRTCHLVGTLVLTDRIMTCHSFDSMKENSVRSPHLLYVLLSLLAATSVFHFNIFKCKITVRKDFCHHLVTVLIVSVTIL